MSKVSLSITNSIRYLFKAVEGGRWDLAVRASLARPPLVGREKELEYLLNRLGQAISGNGSMVLIAGEAGIGKTRLIEELQSHAEALGCQILSGRCIPGAPFPFLPFREAFASSEQSGAGRNGSAFSSSEKSSATRTFDSLFIHGEDSQITESDRMSENQVILFSTLDILRAYSERLPILLFLDDIHWADSASIQMLHFLGRNVGRLRVLIVATYRAEELIPTVHGPHQLLSSIRVMKREGVCFEIQLSNLDANEIKKTLEDYALNPIDIEITDRIVHESEGNPLFALETVRWLIDSDRIFVVNGIWRIKGEIALEVPSSVRDVILRRIEMISRPKRRILECASVVGERFEPDLIAKVLSMNKLTLLEDLEILARENQLLNEEDEGYLFAHERIREVLYDQISRARRSELHRCIGEYIESREVQGEETLGALSLHFYHAGLRDKCLNFSLQAGERCVERFAGHEAIPYFERAMEMAEEGSKFKEERFRAIEGLGDAYLILLNWERAYNEFQQLLGQDVKENLRARLLRKCLECWEPARMGKGHIDIAARIVEEAAKLTDIEPKERAEMISNQGYLALWMGEFDRCRELFATSIAMFEGLDQQTRAAWELTASSIAEVSQLRLDDALVKLDKANKIYEKYPWPWGLQECQQSLGRIYICTGEYEKAINQLDRALDICRKLGFERESAWACFLKSLIYYLEGDMEMASSEAEQSLDHAVRYGSGYMEALPSAFLAYLYTRSGKLDMARHQLRCAIDNITTMDFGIKTPLWGLVKAAEGEVEAALKNYETSKLSFESGIGLFEGVHYGPLYEATVLIWYGDSLSQRGEFASARKCYEQSKEVFLQLGNKYQVEKLIKKVSASNVDEQG